MEHIEKSKEAIYGIFICDSDIKEATISVFSESKCELIQLSRCSILVHTSFE